MEILYKSCIKGGRGKIFYRKKYCVNINSLQLERVPDVRKRFINGPLGDESSDMKTKTVNEIHQSATIKCWIFFQGKYIACLKEL